MNGIQNKTRQITAIAAAAACYTLWSIFLLDVHRSPLTTAKILFSAAPVLAGLGVFLLSRRWLSGWGCSLLSGLIYGFGPFGISFLGFHPVTGFTFAAIPWLLLPSIYWRQGHAPTAGRLVVRAGLCLLPFGFIIGFFWVFSQHWIGPVFLLPGKMAMSFYDFAGLILPLSSSASHVIFSIYHAPLLAATMGVLVYLSAQRVLLLAVPAAGLVMAFLEPICGVSPVIWAALPMVFLSILAGLGVQSLLFAGKSDAKWVLFCGVLGLGLTILCAALYLPYRAQVYAAPLLMYATATAGTGLILMMAHKAVRLLPIRWLILAGVIALDCWVCGRWLTDRFI